MSDGPPDFRGVSPEPIGPSPTAGPYLNQRFRREGPVSTGTQPPTGRRNSNDMRPMGNSPRLKRGR